MLSLHLNNFQRSFSDMVTLYDINRCYYFYILSKHFSKVILTTEKVVTATLK